MSDSFTMRGARCVGDKILVTYSLHVDINRAVNHFATGLNMKKNELHREALLEYITNHKHELPDDYKLTINLAFLKAPEKKEAVKCLNGRCKENAVTSGVYGGVEYPLCTTHAANYAGVKGWVLS